MGLGACSRRWFAAGTCLVWLTACGKSSSSRSEHENGRGGNAGAPNTGGSSGGGNEGGVGAMSGEGGTGPEDCTGAGDVVPTRVVRLSFTQVESAVAELVGSDVARSIASEVNLPTRAERAFPPLSSASDGPVIDATVWMVGDAIGQAVGRYVLDNFEAVTDCGQEPTDECGELFVETFAERAARRPLTAVERDNFLTVYNECKAVGGTVREAVQHGVYAAIESPLFLYRFELGESAPEGEEVELTPYETASLLSFFLTDGPPDAELLAAAADGSIVDTSVLESETMRLIATPAARENFGTALRSYFGYLGLPTIIIDSMAAPDFTNELRDAMVREGELFFDDVLFGDGPVAELLTARRSAVNAGLAALYGIEGFPNGATLDDEGFARVALPESRAGLLTMPGFLTTKSYPEFFSTMHRAMVVNVLVACETVSFEGHQMIGAPPDATERERALLRAADPACLDCHTRFDPFGVALEGFDIIGRERTEDAQGRPIDPSVTLHEEVGGARVANAAAMAAELARSDVFAACLAKNLVVFALADIVEGMPATRKACAVRDIERAFVETGDESFAGLVRQVVRSPFLRTRLVKP